MDSRTNRIIIASVITVLVEALFIAGFQLSAEEGLFHRIMIALGGDFLGGGYIQFFTYLAFFLGVLELIWFLKLNKREGAFLKAGILPEEEYAILDAGGVNQLRIRMADYLRDHRHDTERQFFLVRVLHKAATKFRSNMSVAEVLDVVTTQCRLNSAQSESHYSIIRYLAWVIPSLGFIGTVLGISQALGLANSGDIDLITSTLGIAFDTTLVALFLSIILMLQVHQLEESTEKLHADIEEYVVDKFINRIDVG